MHDGGAILVQTYSNATINNCHFTSNQASVDGGAIYIKRRCFVKINNSSFQFNEAENNGGSILVQHSKSQIKSCTFDSDSATTGQGGSIYIENVGNVTIIETLFSNCKSIIGGSITVKTESILITQYLSIHESFSNSSGGGLFVSHKSLLDATNLTISGSHSTLGGGITVSDSSRITLRQSNLSNNTAFQSGGAISCQQGTIVLDEGMMRNNTARENGGALFAENCHLTFDNITFHENKAQHDGGGLYSKSSSTNIHNSKGIQNTVGSTGGFILITIHSNMISHYLVLEENVAEVTDNAISIVNNSVAIMKHTKLLGLLSNEHCLFTVTSHSKLTIASLYSMNNNSTVNTSKTELKHMVCSDSGSQVSGLETGEYFLYVVRRRGRLAPRQPLSVCALLPAYEENRHLRPLGNLGHRLRRPRWID